MSLEALVQQVGRALGEARGLFRHEPAPGAWGSTGAISDARDTVAQAGAVAQDSPNPGLGDPVPTCGVARPVGRITAAIWHMLAGQGDTIFDVNGSGVAA